MSETSEFDWEPTPGLPAKLPAGEKMLWQGSPDWIALAVRAFHVRKVAIYFLAIVLFDLVIQFQQGTSVDALIAGPGLTAVLSLGAIGILLGLAWLTANVTIYTLTSRRLLIRFGIAIQLTINLPFKQIAAARLHVSKNGIGDIPLELTDNKRVSYIVLWPHIRAWKIARPQPMLRAIPDAAKVAQLISDAAALELKDSLSEQMNPSVAKTVTPDQAPQLAQSASFN